MFHHVDCVVVTIVIKLTMNIKPKLYYNVIGTIETKHDIIKIQN